jgi:hypothetical protein
MNIASRCKTAIRAAGGTACLLRGDKKLSFAASVQPSFREIARSGSVLGPGDTDRFILYAACEDAVMEIGKGDRILWRGRLFDVRRIETVYLKDDAAYRKGELRACTPEREGSL